MEEKNCPALVSDFIAKSEFAIEVFFIDIGMGLHNSLSEYYKEFVKKNYKYPVRELFIKVLRDGIRKTVHNIDSAYGGLHMLARIIQENNGYIWCKDVRKTQLFLY